MYLNFFSILEIRKYIDRNPKIAKIFELNTINGSAVIARIAGMLSKANKISVSSMMSNATNRGVAARTPMRRIKKFSPSILLVTGKNRRVYL